MSGRADYRKPRPEDSYLEQDHRSDSSWWHGWTCGILLLAVLVGVIFGFVQSCWGEMQSIIHSTGTP